MTLRRMFVPILAVLAAAAPALAGPLTPPAGPVGSSMKTIQQAEPRTPVSAATTPGGAVSVYSITQSGSYYLTGNISAAVNKFGIEILVPDVTLDLNGFTISGVAGSYSGVRSQYSNVTVRNGIVRDCGGRGVDLFGAPAGRVEGVTCEANVGDGICVGAGSVVQGCAARGNGMVGVLLYSNCTVIDTVSSGNATGFDIASGGVATRCTAGQNSGAGFTSSDGIDLRDCSAITNGGIGFELTWGSRATGCNAYVNGHHGFRFGAYCHLENNIARSNGAAAGVTGAGFYGDASGTRTVLRGNNARQNDIGVQLAGANNLVVGNACTMNATNFVLAANNRVATIVTLGLSPAISGNAGGTAVSTPDANYVY